MKLICTSDEIRQLRSMLQMSQAEFASKFGFNLAVFRHWEQGFRRPGGHAQLLLTIIAHSPDSVKEAIQIARDASKEAKKKVESAPLYRRCTI